MIKKIVIVIALLIGLGFILIPYDQLELYKKKRNFTTSPEPSGNSMKKSSDEPIFVIQKHNASHVHYDFRLEINGVLKSWAIPKGPSTQPHEKRLAIETEDHPIDYATFEGIIPQGQYGAGAVMIWDNGTFENSKTENNKLVTLHDSYKNGQIEVLLKGKKIQGNYALIRIDSDNKKWLLIKTNDTHNNSNKKNATIKKKQKK